TLLADRIPRPLMRAAAAATRLLPRASDGKEFMGRLGRFARTGALPFYERFAEGFGAADLALDRLLRPEVLADASALTQTRYFAPYLARVGPWTPLSRLLYLNFKTYLADDLLVKTDRATMAHGLEGRSPLLDRKLVEYAAGLPDDW